MVTINMNRMTSALVGSKPSEAAWATASEQVGAQAKLVVGKEGGIQSMVDVTVVGWSPSYGRSRWLVKDAGGSQEVVAAERLVL